MTSVVPYEEISSHQRQEATDKELEAIHRDEAVIEDGRAKIKHYVISVTNAMWRQGSGLQRICGHQQVTFSFVKNLQERLPKTWGNDTRDVFTIAKGRVAVTCRQETQIKGMEEIGADFRRDLLHQLELLTPKERAAMGPAPQMRNELQLFLSNITRIKQDLQKTIRLIPMEQWTPAQRAELVNDTQWVAEAREQAMKLGIEER